MISCVIPLYNEDRGIYSIIESLLHVKEISEIICVDDASPTALAPELKKRFPNVKLIRLTQNVGKAGAVFAGVAASKGQEIFLLDCDITGLTPEEIANSIEVFRIRKLDMLILRTGGNNRIIDTLLRKFIFLSGNRLMRKMDLLEIEKMKPVGYQLEMAINTFMLDSGKHMAWIASSLFNPHKVAKFGWRIGLKRDVEMEMTLMQFRGMREYVRQMVFVAREEA